MQRGRKLKSPDTKKLAKTFKASVDGNTASIVEVEANCPMPPAWLSEGARDVWITDIHRAVKCGATDVDSHTFAIYCTTMASFIASAKAGEPINAAFTAELRKQCEMFGMAGAKSRLARIGDAPVKASASPYSKRPD